VVQTAVDAFGGVDVLVNNAGVGYSYRQTRPKSMEPIADSPPDDWDHVMAINLGSVVHCIRAVLPVMREAGKGSIVNVASVLGFRGQPDAHAYTTAKGGIINLTRSVAITYAKEGVRCNVVCPGYIETPMVAEYIDMLNAEDFRYQWNPTGRMGKDNEIANGILFLASDEASYCNGAQLTIDGGMTAKML
jgi:meso-butanediol dehydrogenase / (S,S)-butanediol dehydrogenase / diacetyl reductase